MHDPHQCISVAHRELTSYKQTTYSAIIKNNDNSEVNYMKQICNSAGKLVCFGSEYPTKLRDELLDNNLNIKFDESNASCPCVCKRWTK